MIPVGAALLILGLTEVGQHLLIAPAGVAEVAPAIVVLALSTDIEETVDRRRSAEHFAARLRDLSVAGPRLRLAGIEPVHRRIGEMLAVAEGYVDPRACCPRPRPPAAARTRVPTR